jgi:hypothetical protein
MIFSVHHCAIPVAADPVNTQQKCLPSLHKIHPLTTDALLRNTS